MLQPVATETDMENPFDSVESAINDIAAGKIVIVTDDENRENEGDLVMAASKVTPESVNMMIRYCSGVVCVPATEPQLKRLGLNPMVPQNRESYRTDYTVSVDAAEGITTGISAFDRAATIKLLADPTTTADQLVQPGHVFPLRARPGGVLERAGHTEAIVDLASLAGLAPCGVICEVVNDDGTMARLPELIEFKKKFGLRMISIADLIEYRHRKEKLVELVATQPFPSAYGEFRLHIFRNRLDGVHHFAFTMGDLDAEPTLVRVQSENLLSDVFQRTGMNGHESLDQSFHAVAEAQRGVVLYMAQPHGGLNINEIKKPSDTGNPNLSTVQMDARARGIGAQILAALGLKKIRLLSHGSKKVVALDGYGLQIVEQVPLD